MLQSICLDHISTIMYYVYIYYLLYLYSSCSMVSDFIVLLTLSFVRQQDISKLVLFIFRVRGIAQHHSRVHQHHMWYVQRILQSVYDEEHNQIWPLVSGATSMYKCLDMSK